MAVKAFNEREPRFNEYTNHEGVTVRIDPTLAHNLLCLLEAAKKTSGDIVLVIDGEEGSGKSTLARQIAKFLDPTLTESRIEFNPEDAIKAHFRGLPEKYDPREYMKGHYPSKPWEVVILDESADLDRKKTMSAGSIEFTGFTTQSRQLHKIFIIILPTIHILNSYIAEHRAVAFLHCYKHERTDMGFYKWYGRKAIKEMFKPDMHRQKLYSHKDSFSGRFSGKEAFDITRYEQKKADALNRYRKIETEKAVDKDELFRLDRRQIMRIYVQNGYRDDKMFYTCLEMPARSWRTLKKEVREELGVEAPAKGANKRVKDLLEQTLDKPTDDDYTFFSPPEEDDEAADG